MNGYIHKKSQKYRGSQFLEPNFLEAPRSVDWREKGYVTPVKDQVCLVMCFVCVFDQFESLIHQITNFGKLTGKIT